MPGVTSLFDCPLPAALSAIPNAACQVSPGNIVAVAFQQRQATASFTQSSIKLQATWTPLQAASGATKTVIVPLNNFETTPGEMISEGGNDQTTFRGRPRFKAIGFSAASAIVQGITPAHAKAIAALTKFSSKSGQRSDLRAFLFTDEDNILCGDDYNGIEIFNLMLMDVKLGGSFKQTMDYGIQWGMDGTWSYNMVIEKAAFDLSLLQNS